MLKSKKINEFEHVMIDIETLSTKNNARILTISAVKFNLLEENQNKIENELEMLIDQDLTYEEMQAFDINVDTMSWWEKREKEIYEYNFKKEPRINLKDALIRLNEFLGKSTKHFWCQGMNFDPIILEHAYSFYGLKPVWKFYEWRDSRTIIKLLYEYNPPNSNQNNHKSIDDCKNQIKNLKHVINMLQRKSIFD